ncbi:MAG: hypothetical protein ABI640_02560 [Gammaproteobacteria bacterium]
MFHVVTVGWAPLQVERLWRQIEERSGDRCSHIVHPRFVARQFRGAPSRVRLRFFRDDLSQRMPEPDLELLTSLEQEGVPTIHNMILGDRVVSRLDYQVALAYATFLAKRLIELFGELDPSVVIGDFDGLHGGVALAVARRMKIPWFALHFGVLPSGMVCLCKDQSPAVREQVVTGSPSAAWAETLLKRFEHKSVRAPAYIAPRQLSLMGELRKLPARMIAVGRTMRRARLRDGWQFTEEATDYSVGAAVRNLLRARAAGKAISKVGTLDVPPDMPFVFFGLHMQPESTVDVWAPFFSNQMWVIELLSRAIPPSHKLLVKIHKSDVANYSQKQLGQMKSFPGVEIVRPFADSRAFVEAADLVVAIQGTLGLEAALLGIPVIMLGNSPITLFPSATRVGEISDLPKLIRSKLAESRPDRSKIIEAYVSYLSPFMPAGHNNWTVEPTTEEVDGYVNVFRNLKNFLTSRPIVAAQERSAGFRSG